MNLQRFAQLLAGLLVPLGLVFAGLSVLLESFVFVGVGVLTAGFGAGTYWAISRYEDEVYELINADVDLTSKQTFLAGLVQAGLTIVQFALLSWLSVQFGLVASGDMNGAPPSILLIAVGVGLGGFLGGAVPYLVQRNETVNRLNDSPTGRIGGQFLTFGSFVALLILHPVVAVWYIIAYVGSRITVLLGFFVVPRL